MFMDAFDAYKKYLAIKLHFTQDSYDYFRYNGQTRTDKTKFELRKDKYMFHRLAKKFGDNLELYLASILKEKPDAWVGDLLDDGSLNEYWQNARKNKESLSYTFQTDLSQFDSLNDAFIVRDGEWPKIVTAYQRSKVSIETMVIIMEVVKPFPYWDDHISDTVIWPRIRRKIQKYAQFIRNDIDRGKIKDILESI
jgi:hypothetical protein